MATRPMTGTWIEATHDMFEFFVKHPRSVGETYLEHLVVAASFGLMMIAGGLACLVHAIVPAAFEHTASRMISALNTRMVTNRRRRGNVDLDYAI
jgi:hypothetical protein